MRRFLKRTIGLLTLVSLLLLAVGALADDPRSLRSAIAARFPSVVWLTTEELASRMNHSGLLLLDARTQDEFAISHLQHAVRIDPEMPNLEDLPTNHDVEIVVYCSVGYRSADIAQQLMHAGYMHVRNLEGGIFRWANQNREVYRGTRPVRLVHPYDVVWGRFLDAGRRSQLP